MLRRTYQQFIVIAEQDARTFQDELNKALQEHAEEQPEATINMDGGFSACISYRKDVCIPETISDRYELDGVRYVCGECPFFKLSEDRRIKFYYCEESGETRRCSYESRACDFLYQEIESGRVKI